MVDKCHENGMVVNFCQADKVNDAKWLLDMGVDCILTNDFHLVYEGVKSRLGKKHIFRKR
jgi:glycerophosphoryl diester phosphodiesterase